MPTNLGTVYATIELRLKDFTNAVNKVSQDMGKLERDITRRADRIGREFRDLGRDMSIGLTAPLAIFGKGVLDATVKMDSMRRSLNSLNGSQEETEKQLKRLREAAKLPGLGFEQLVDGTVKLQAAGIAAHTAERSLKAFGNAVALAAGSKEDLGEVARQLAQIAGAGKLQGDELKIIAERAPIVRKVLRDAFGTSSTEEIAKFGLSVEQIFEILNRGLERLPQATQSMRSSLDNLSDNFDDLKRTIGERFAPDIERAIGALDDAVQGATKWFKELDHASQQALGNIASALAVGGPVMLAFGGLFALWGRIAANPFFRWLIGAIKSNPQGIAGGGIQAGIAGMFQRGSGASNFLDNIFNPSQRIDANTPLTPQQLAIQKDPNSEYNRWVRELNRQAQQRKSMEGKVYDPISGKVRPMIDNAAADRAYYQSLAKQKDAEEKARKERERRAKQAIAEAKRNAERIAEINREAAFDLADPVQQALMQRNDRAREGMKPVLNQRLFQRDMREVFDAFDRAAKEEAEKRAADGKGGLLSDIMVTAGGNRMMSPQFESTLRQMIKEMRRRIEPILQMEFKEIDILSMFGFGKGKAEFLGVNNEMLENPFKGALDAAIEKIGKEPSQKMAENLLDPKAIGEQLKVAAQEAKAEANKFTFNLGAELGSNLAMEMGREFGNAFDKIFGTGNPLARALSRTLSRLVDDLMYTLAQRALGSRLILSLGMSGLGAGGAVAGGAAAAGAAAAGGAAGAGGAGAAAGGAAAGAGLWPLVIAAAVPFIGKALGLGKSNLREKFGAGFIGIPAVNQLMNPGFNLTPGGVAGAGGININFYGSSFNNNQDPRRAASTIAWHVDRQMRTRTGS